MLIVTHSRSSSNSDAHELERQRLWRPAGGGAERQFGRPSPSSNDCSLRLRRPALVQTGRSRHLPSGSLFSFRASASVMVRLQLARAGAAAAAPAGTGADWQTRRHVSVSTLCFPRPVAAREPAAVVLLIPAQAQVHSCFAPFFHESCNNPGSAAMRCRAAGQSRVHYTSSGVLAWHMWHRGECNRNTLYCCASISAWLEGQCID